MLILMLSGCSTLDVLSDRVAHKTPQQELQALFAQPYIDPLTDYLRQHPQEARYGEVWLSVVAERDRRCRQVAQRYAQRDKTEAVLARYRAGYVYSCPQQVEAFAEQVAQAESGALRAPDTNTDSVTDSAATVELAPVQGNAAANECYLLAQIHNYADALPACSVPARAGDLRAQRALADSLSALQRFDEARGWLLKAAQRRDTEAQIRLAEMSLNAQAGTADPAQAWAWYRQAGDLARAARLEAGLTPQQRQLALQRVRQQLDIGH